MSKLLVLVLNKVESLDDILKDFSKAGIKGSTILESKGMAQELSLNEDFEFFGSLRKILSPNRKNNVTLLVAVHGAQVDVATDIINKHIDLETPNSGILFVVPIDYIKGLKF